MGQLGSDIVDSCLDCPFGMALPMSAKASCSRQPEKEAIGFSQLTKLFETCPLKVAPVLVQLRGA